MMKNKSVKRVSGFMFFAFLLLMAVFSANAQEKTGTMNEAQNKVSLIIVNYLPAGVNANASASNSIIFETFVNQLGKSKKKVDFSVAQLVSQTEETDRAKILEKAQAETENYLVWIKVENPSATTQRTARLDLEKTLVKYAVFAPKTLICLIDSKSAFKENIGFNLTDAKLYPET